MNDQQQNIENIETLKQQSLLTVPLSKRGIPVWTVYISALLSVVYILNPTAGFIEFLPDNIPLIGNLDEGAATIAIWYGLVEFFEVRNKKRRK